MINYYENASSVAILRGREKSRENEQTVVELFGRQVGCRADYIAIKDQERELSYKQLSLIIDKIATYIISVPQIKKRVAVLIQNSIESVACVMGVLKAKSAYVPLDIKNGAFRNMNILLDSSPDLIIISRRYLNQIRQDSEWTMIALMLAHKNRYVVIEEILSMEYGDNYKKLEKVNMTDLAYIMYTSGTTGKPKGIAVSHYNLINFMLWAKDEYISRIDSKETLMFPFYASLAFDMTAISLFLPLITGNAIVVYESSNSGYVLSRIFNENLVDILVLTPSQLQIMEEFNFDESKLKVLIAGGEILKSNVAKKISNLFLDNIKIFNLYGPTETTIGCMSYEYDPSKNYHKSIPIGGPIDNTNIYILKDDMSPAKVNEVGEVFISGINVTGGYLNQSDLTCRKFLKDKYSENYRVMYKTNDLAILKDDGTVSFVGRSDNQIKLNGYRIELDEIETHIVNYNKVKDAAVVLFHESNKDYICAFITCKEKFDSEVLRKYLITRLPIYMLPQKYVFLSGFPYTSNGKIDRKKLIQTLKK